MRSHFFSRWLCLMGVWVLLLVAVSPAGASSRESGAELPASQGRLAAPSATGEIKLIAAGGDHICALTIAGAVKCWGRNDQRQLGDGSFAAYHTIPVAVVGLSSGVEGITAGNLHTCALTSAGAVKCWGSNSFGQLGNGGTSQGTIPADVVGLTSGIKAIAGGNNFTCALTSAGGVKCWGDNFYGQLGDDSTTQRLTPVDVVGLSDITMIVVGGSHACALTNTGGVKCWGNNDSGQLGDTSTDERHVPVDVVGLSGITGLTAGGSHTCALTASGGVMCWGSNLNGQLGIGIDDEDPHSTPVEVNGLSSNMAALTSGASHTCALVDDNQSIPLAERGKVKCWGFNSYGQLGIGTQNDSYVPVDVTDLSGMMAITAGYSHTCALRGDGLINCWGFNFFGQLGDGSRISRLSPVVVSNPKLYLSMIRH